MGGNGVRRREGKVGGEEKREEIRKGLQQEVGHCERICPTRFKFKWPWSEKNWDPLELLLQHEIALNSSEVHFDHKVSECPWQPPEPFSHAGGLEGPCKIYDYFQL